MLILSNVVNLIEQLCVFFVQQRMLSQASMAMENSSDRCVALVALTF